MNPRTRKYYKYKGSRAERKAARRRDKKKCEEPEPDITDEEELMETVCIRDKEHRILSDPETYKFLQVAHCQSLPHGEDRIMCFVDRREWLSKRDPQPCPKCGDKMQQQLMDHMSGEDAEWKCRYCMHKYFYEPK